VVDGTPASAAKCADTMVGTKGLHFVFTGLNASSQSADPIFESAGLFFTGIPLTPADEASKGADFINGGSSASQAAVGEFMVKNLHAKKIGIIADDSPVTIAAAEEVQNVGKKYGVSSVIEEPAPDAVDMTGNYEAMATAGVDAIAFLIYPNQVASFVQAARSQGSKIPLVTEDAVVPTSVEAQLGNQVKGIYLGSLAANPLGNTPDAVAFRAAAQKYDGSNWKVALTGEGVSEYQDLMTIYKNALLKIPYNTISGKTIQAALNKPGTATLGPPYQCGLPSPLPAICSFTDIFSLYGGPPTFAEEPIGGTHPVINARALIDSGVVPK
jgi:ABC-type branched-subunit amino acid transport system substrate-binding protein